MTDSGILSNGTRFIAMIFAMACAALILYCIMLVYAAMTFEHDSLPGPAVLSIIAVGVGLAALLCGGLAHLLWKVSKRTRALPQPIDGMSHGED